MKSRTSCYDPATGRMNLRRFAPAWALYALGLVLLVLGSVTQYRGDTASNIVSLGHALPVIALLNCGWALVTAQLFFGDLYSPRLCYGLHTMPITRGSWFGTQIILGICGSLAANLLAVGLMSLVITEFRIVLLYWLASSELQFLFFYGVAVLCAVCAGNRIGMLLLYGIVNLAGALALWLRTHLYARLIYGLHLPGKELLLWCPLAQMTESSPWEANIVVLEEPVCVTDNYSRLYDIESVTLEAPFWELVLYAVLGCLAIWLALKLYHRRRLECSGDLLAFPKMEPVILVLTSLCAGGVGHFFNEIIYWEYSYLMLFLGIAAGYYICLMLLRRRVNVITPKSLAAMGAICAVMLLSLVLTGLDVLGIGQRVPPAAQVAKVQICLSNTNSDLSSADPQRIEEALAVQRMALEEHGQAEKNRPLLERIFGSEEEDICYLREDGQREMTALVYLTYTMEDGSTFRRIYQLHESGPYISIFREQFSQPEVVFSSFGTIGLDEDGGYRQFLANCDMVRLECSHSAEESEWGEANVARQRNIAQEDWPGLMEAMLADCKAGNMAQTSLFHADDPTFDRIYFYCDIGVATSWMRGYYIYESCTNTLNYLIEKGYHNPLT